MKSKSCSCMTSYTTTVKLARQLANVHTRKVSTQV
jgi:hypothetical protein